MPILALKPEGLVIPSIHASMVRAFRSLGQEVLELDFPKNEGEVRSLRSIAARGRGSIFTVDLPTGENKNFCIKEIQSILSIPWVIWFVDDPEGYGFPESLDPSRTVLFCWDGDIVETIRSDGFWRGSPPVHLPLAADPEIFYPQETASPSAFPGGVFVGSTAHPNSFLEKAIRNSPGFEGDISNLWGRWEGDLAKASQDLAWAFLGEKTRIETGTLRRNSLARLWVHSAVYYLGKWKRQEIVSRVIGQGGGVFGNREWEHTAGNLYRGEVRYGESLCRVYQESAFVLDIRQPQSRTGLTQRVFDGSACGIPVLAECSPELESLFDPDRGIFCYRTPEDAKNVKNLLLGDLRASKERAARAREKVLALHTYRCRASQILQTLHRFFALA